MGLAAEKRGVSSENLDRQLEQLRAGAERFARESLSKKIAWLYQMRERVARAAERWAALTCEHQRLDAGLPMAGEAWMLGPLPTLRLLRLLSATLGDIERRGGPQLPETPRPLDSGQLALRVFPVTLADRAMLPGVHAEVRITPDANGQLPPPASFYLQKDPPGRVAVVLGAGNVSSIPVLDTLHKLFVEGQVVLLKLNPVNEYLGPLFAEVLKPLIDQGYLAIAYGGAEVGQQLCRHPLVDEIHITGSDRTHDAIVWGEDEAERDRRRQLSQPLLDKRITSELGNISPVIVVPGPYTDRQFEAMAESIAGMVTHNASFNCVSAKMLVLPRGWPGSERLVAAIGSVFDAVPTRYAYYPGALERYQALTRDVTVETHGASGEGRLPWTIVRGLDERDPNTLHFRMEPFCSILSVVELDRADEAAFLARATEFCNQTLWGTLNAMLFVAPERLDDPACAAQVELGIQALRYGVLAVNQWSAVAYVLGTTPWGGHPSTTRSDIQSGQGWVHNAFMLEGVEKCVLRGPLVSPFRVPWSPLHRTCQSEMRELCAFEAEPSLWSLSKAGYHAVRG
ncbi:MAG TPA: aldehyde dehydrogenase family protein [Polyangiaceae bacterium]|nr:aldehyde dehydrogenase family protein [Polyangiaceae bacterium]